MQTSPEMNEKIVAMLRLHDNPAVLYAAARIEELERQLREIRLAARAVLTEASNSEAVDSVAMINLREAMTYRGGP